MGACRGRDQHLDGLDLLCLFSRHGALGLKHVHLQLTTKRKRQSDRCIHSFEHSVPPCARSNVLRLQFGYRESARRCTLAHHMWDSRLPAQNVSFSRSSLDVLHKAGRSFPPWEYRALGLRDSVGQHRSGIMQLHTKASAQRRGPVIRVAVCLQRCFSC